MDETDELFAHEEPNPDQLTLGEIPVTAEQEIELYLRSGRPQTEIAAKGYDASLVAQVASRLPAELDIDRIPY